MYTLNSAVSSMPLHQESAFTHEKVSAYSPAGPAFSATRESSPLCFRLSRLIESPIDLSNISSALSLAHFLISFLHCSFAPQLEEVDFYQALTALDYLKDLETRRRKEVVTVLIHLGIDRTNMGQKQEMD